MALVTCPECSGSVSDVAPACPHCGFPLGKAHKEEPPAPEFMTTWRALFAAVFIVAAVVWAGSAAQDRAKRQAGSAVSSAREAAKAAVGPGKRILPVNPVTTDRCITCFFLGLDDLLRYRDRGDKLGYDHQMKTCVQVPAGVKTSVVRQGDRTTTVEFHGWTGFMGATSGAVETSCLE